MMSPGVRLFHMLRRLLPAAVDARYGDAMEAQFGEELAAARALGSRRVARVSAAALSDLVRRALYERWRAFRRGSRHPKPQQARGQRISSIIADVRFAIRSFARQPGSTALVVSTLGLAVAANTAVFSLLDAIFLRPFPFPQANRLVYLNETAPRWNLTYTGIDYRDYLTWRRRARDFSGMAVWSGQFVNLASDGRAERIPAATVSYDFSDVLGIRPVIGRFFRPDEDRPNGPNVVAIGYDLWQTRFGGTNDVVGRTLRINSTPYEVVGVLPREAEFPDGAKLWLPLDENPKATDHSYALDGIGRLKPGVSIEAAARDLNEAHVPVWLATDSTHLVSPLVMPLRDHYVEDFRGLARALSLGAILVVLIACANVAGAMLARSVFRRREIAIRLALGANASRVARQLLTESIVLSAAGGVLGALVGGLGLKAFLSLDTAFVPPWALATAGPRTMVFAAAVVVAMALLFGLVPVLELRHPEVHGTIASAVTRTTTARRDRRLLDALVVVEVALAVVLLTGGGLLLRAYRALRSTDPGFNPQGVAMFRVSLPSSTYKSGTRQMAFYDALMDRIRTQPGVDHVAIITCPPLGCHWGNFYKAEGAPAPGRDEQDPVTLTRYASPDYFSTMGVRFVHGRPYGEHEGNARTGFRPVVINEQLAHRLWPNVPDPTGKRLESRGDTSSNWSTVVGVVHDVKHYGLGRKMIPGLYFPTTRIDSSSDFDTFAFVVHGKGEPASLFSGIRAAVRALDPELPVADLRTAETTLDKSFASAKTIALALSAFAAIALTLAVGGIYSVLSYVVGRRRHEIGIRMALGAQRSRVLRLVVRQGLTLVAIGMVIGVPAALLSSRFLSALLIGVSARDPMSYGAAVVVLAATSTVAALLPARRAAGVDPRVALSEDA